MTMLIRDLSREEFHEMKNIIAQRACWYIQRGWELRDFLRDNVDSSFPPNIVSQVWEDLEGRE